MTAVIITGGIDLSVGSILCLSAMVTGVVLNAGHGVWIGIAAGLAASLVVGLVNGVLIAYVGIPPFVTTLGMLSVARSLAMVASQNRMVYQFGPDHELFLWLGGGSTRAFRIRWSCWALLPRRRVRAALDALGRARSWPWAATSGRRSLTGLPVKRIKVGIYMLSGVHGRPGRRARGELARRRDDQPRPVDGAQRDRRRGHRRRRPAWAAAARSWAPWSAPR